MINAYATLSHFRAHLDPIIAALPPDLIGTVYSRDSPPPIKRDLSRPFLVASFADAQAVAPNPYVLQDHGSGQSYIGVTNGSYSGGDGHERCILFLCPSERVAQRWRERYPNTPAVAIGCPRLDRYSERAGPQGEAARGSDQELSVSPGCMTSGLLPGLRLRPSPLLVARDAPNVSDSAKKSEKVRGETGSAWHKTGEAPLQPGIPTVAVSFHFDCAVCPETRSAWRYYDPHLPRLVADPRFRIVGHGHPRLWPTILRRWQELGVEPWSDVDRVLSEADLVVADNTSLLYEACALNIPTVCLNIPGYRREVEHGGRFWSAPPGPQVDHPSELADAICRALDDPPAHRAIRARAVEWAYSAVDGHASERAATAIMEVL